VVDERRKAGRPDRGTEVIRRASAWESLRTGTRAGRQARVCELLHEDIKIGTS
jgi:hypothetical protein